MSSASLPRTTARCRRAVPRVTLVPGGHFDMGLTESDLAEARAWSGDDDVEPLLSGWSSLARPVRRVEVAPFWCTVAALTTSEISRLSGGRLRFDTLPRDDARGLAARFGARLPSEAELEWLGRGGGRVGRGRLAPHV